MIASTRVAHPIAALALVGLAGCFSVEPPAEHACSKAHPECPDGFDCLSTQCVPKGEGLVLTLAGGVPRGFADGLPLTARFDAPTGVAVDTRGAQDLVYVSDSNNHRVRLYDGTSVSTAAGTGTQGDTDGPPSTATFRLPYTLSFGQGNLYVADRENHRIRRIDITHKDVTTAAGSIQGDLVDVAAHQARFSTPVGSAMGRDGTLYIADSMNHRIRALRNATVTTFAGSSEGYLDGVAAQAQFRQPYSIAVDTSGTAEVVYVADRGNACIRMIKNGQVTTVAGVPGAPGRVDGPATSAKFALPNAIALDPTRARLYVADRDNHLIRVVDLAKGKVTTLAGSGDGYQDGPALTAKFKAPNAVAVGQDGRVYVADRDNNRLRVILIAP